MRLASSSLLVLVLAATLGCGADAAPDAGASASAEPSTAGGEAATAIGLEIDGFTFAACALEDCPDEVREAWVDLSALLSPIDHAPRGDLDEPSQARWYEATFLPFWESTRVGMEATLARLIVYPPRDPDPDPDQTLRGTIATLVMAQRMTAYLDAIGAGPPVRGGCGGGPAAWMEASLVQAAEAAELCVRQAGAASPAMRANAPACAAAAERARAAIEASEEEVCEVDVPL